MRVAALVSAAVCLACAPGCGRRPVERPVASLVQTKGEVERAEGEGWRASPVGDRFAIGDTIRTGVGAEARLRLDGGSVVRLGENARLRFQRGQQPGVTAPEIRIEQGVAEIESPGDEAVGPALAVETPAGRTRIERGARARVSASDQSALLEVLVGRAVVLRPEGDQPIEAGQGARLRLGSAEIEKLDLRVGRAVVERAPPAEPVGAPAPPPVPAETPPVPAEAPPAAELSPTAAPNADPVAAPPRLARDRSEHADVTISAGESAVLHDRRRSLAVRLRFDHLCPAGGTVELARPGRARAPLSADAAVVLSLRSGKQPYRVRCEDDPAGGPPRASGTLSLRRDSGEVPLPARTPANTIDADGRRYTILFQSRPPILTLVWPKAPAGANDLELHLQSPAGIRTIPANEGRHRLASGALAEGVHTWWFATRDGRESPRTTVALRFDNTAPTAQFFKAPPAADTPGAVPVDGVTLPGTVVSVAGQRLQVDEHGRFRAAVAPLDGDAAVAVRLEPARGGVHYYVRRRPEGR